MKKLFLIVGIIVLAGACDEKGSVNSCGDNTMDVGEECDGSNLGAETCQTLGFHFGGKLSCTSDCRFDSLDCIEYGRCGDGLDQPDEQCDGENLFGNSCEIIGFELGGTLSCGEDCYFDTSECLTLAVCGDDTAEGPEDCDLSDLKGKICVDLGYYGGVLACDSSCEYDLSDCKIIGECGDGVIQEDFEDCDGELLLYDNCDGYGYWEGTGDSSFVCDESCNVNLDICGGSCGDGLVQEGLEDCDIDDLANNTCLSSGGTWFGDISCKADCTLNTDVCKNTLQDGTSGIDVGKGVAIDAAGNTIVVGYSTGNWSQAVQGSTDIILIKYDPKGSEVWRVQLGTVGDEEAYGVDIDSSNNIFVTGYTSGDLAGIGTVNGEDIFLLKFDSFGTLLWSRQWGSPLQTGVPDSSYDRGRSVKIDDNDDVYVIGYSNGVVENSLMTSSDISVTKVENDGNQLWVYEKTSGLEGEGAERGIDLEFSPDGSLLILCNTNGTLGGSNLGGFDPVVISLTTDGQEGWISQINGESDNYGVGISMHSNKLIISGYTWGVFDSSDATPQGADLFLAEFSFSSGIVSSHYLWGTDGSDYVSGLVVDDDDNIYVIGNTSGAFRDNVNKGQQDIFITEFNANMEEGASYMWGSNAAERVYGAAYDGVSISLCGYTLGSLDSNLNSGDEDLFMMKYPSPQ
jgi:Beta-propeller repeat